MKPIVSIVIPIYNTREALLRTCINSACEQTFENIEIILVNDGSTAPHIDPLLDLYSVTDDRIVCVKKENGGVAQARQIGVEKSTGDYILFLDSDDRLTNDAIELCVAKAQETNADIVVGSFYEDKYGIITEHNTEITWIDKFDFQKKIMTYCEIGYLWGKLFKKDLFSSNLFIPVDFCMYEDAILLFQLVYNTTHTIAKLNKSICYYIYEPNSLSRSISEKGLFSMIEAIKWIENYIDTHYPYGEISKEVAFYNLPIYAWFLSSGGVVTDNKIEQLIYQKYLRNTWAKKQIKRSHLALIYLNKYTVFAKMYILYRKHLKSFLKKSQQILDNFLKVK